MLLKSQNNPQKFNITFYLQKKLKKSKEMLEKCKWKNATSY